jgi:hypothetical protein
LAGFGGFIARDWLERFAFLNFMGFILAGLRLTFCALAALRACCWGVFFGLAASGAVAPSAITKVNSSALNLIALFYG